MRAKMKKKMHLVGIKGVGMAGLATLFSASGCLVQGSDTEEEFFTDRILRDIGITPLYFNEKNIIADIDAVVYSTAYGGDHPEIQKAKSLGIKLETYTEALARMFNDKKGIMITGTHGKTTTTAMLARVLEEAGWDPTALVGSEVLEWGRTARLGRSPWMVSEGDEYQAKILEMRPYALLVTNVDYDHPDFYRTRDEYEEVFRKLIGRVDKNGIVVKGPFDPKDLGSIKLRLIGEHNASNAAGVLKMARQLGINESITKKALESFQGTRRRMEFYTPRDAALIVIDDYAHHPREIRETLKAIRRAYPERTITAIFQPHTFSRTEVFLDDFARSFSDADRVGILEVYSSMRESKGKIGGKELAEKTRLNHANVSFLGSMDYAEKKIQDFVSRNSAVLVTFGAGDVWRIAERFKKVKF